MSASGESAVGGEEMRDGVEQGYQEGGSPAWLCYISWISAGCEVD